MSIRIDQSETDFGSSGSGPVVGRCLWHHRRKICISFESPRDYRHRRGDRQGVRSVGRRERFEVFGDCCDGIRSDRVAVNRGNEVDRVAVDEGFLDGCLQTGLLDAVRGARDGGAEREHRHDHQDHGKNTDFPLHTVFLSLGRRARLVGMSNM